MNRRPSLPAMPLPEVTRRYREHNDLREQLSVARDPAVRARLLEKLDELTRSHRERLAKRIGESE